MAISDQLLAWYKFEESTDPDMGGQTAIDSSGNGNDATYNVGTAGSTAMGLYPANAAYNNTNSGGRFTNYLQVVHAYSSALDLGNGISLSTDDSAGGGPGFTIAAFVGAPFQSQFTNNGQHPFLSEASGGSDDIMYFEDTDNASSNKDLDGEAWVRQDCYGQITHGLGGANTIDLTSTGWAPWEIPAPGVGDPFKLFDYMISQTADPTDPPWFHLAIKFEAMHDVAVDSSSPPNAVDPGSYVSTPSVQTAVAVTIWVNGEIKSINIMLTQCAHYSTTLGYINGDETSGGFTPPFHHLADVGVWNRPLSGDEIYAISQHGIQGAQGYLDSLSSGGGAPGGGSPGGGDIGGGGVVAAPDPCAGSLAPQCGLGRRYDTTDTTNIGPAFTTNAQLSAGSTGTLINNDTLSCVHIPAGWQMAHETQKIVDEIIQNMDSIMADRTIFTKDDGSDPSDQEFALYKKTIRQTINGIAYRHASSLRTVSGYNITWPQALKTAIMKTEFDTSDPAKIRIAKHGKVALQELYAGVDPSAKYCGVPAAIDSIAIRHGVALGGGGEFSSLNLNGMNGGEPVVIMDIVVKVPKDASGNSSELGWGTNANAKIVWAIDGLNNVATYQDGSEDMWFWDQVSQQDNYGYISLECPGWVESTDPETGETLLSITIAHNVITNQDLVWISGAWADHSSGHVFYNPQITWGYLLYSEAAIQDATRSFKIRAAIFDGVTNDISTLQLWEEANSYSVFKSQDFMFARPQVSSVNVEFRKVSDNSAIVFTETSSGTFSYDDFEWDQSAAEDLNLIGVARYSYINSTSSIPEYAGLDTYAASAGFNLEQNSTTSAAWNWINLDGSDMSLSAPVGSAPSGTSKSLEIQSVPSDAQLNIVFEVEGIAASYEINLLDAAPAITHPQGTSDIIVEIRNDSGDDTFTWVDPYFGSITVTDDLDNGATLPITITGNTFDRRVLTEKDGNPGVPPHTVTYSVTDSGGNTSSISRTLYVVDETPPILTLSGPATGPNSPQILPINNASSWIDPGYSASDNSEVDGTNGGYTVNVDYQYWDHDTGVWVDSATDPSQTFVPINWTDSTDYGHGLVGDNGIVWKIIYEATDTWGNSTTLRRWIGFTQDITAPVFNVTSLTDYTIELTSTHLNSVWNNDDNFDSDTGFPITATDPDDGIAPGNVPVNSTVIYQEPTYTYPGVSYGNSVVLTNPNPIDTSKAGRYRIQHSATNDTGLTSTLERVITIEDTTAPVLTLMDSSTLTVEVDGITQAAPFGYTVTDASDGNAANNNVNNVKVTIVQGVSGNVLGTYSNPTLAANDISQAIDNLTNVEGEILVKYEPTDKAGNTGSVVQKTVQVGCCNLINPTMLMDYPEPAIYYWANINYLNTLNGNNAWFEYADVSREDGDGVIAYGPMSSMDTELVGSYWLSGPSGDTNGDGSPEYVALCFILDPDNSCNVVGFKIYEPSGQITDSWPLAPDWDGEPIWDPDHLNNSNQNGAAGTLVGKKLAGDQQTADSLLKALINPPAIAEECCPQSLYWPITDPAGAGTPTFGGGGNGGNGFTIVFPPPADGSGTSNVPSDDDDDDDDSVPPSDKDLKTNIAMVPNPVSTNYHLLGLYTVEYDWAPVANDLFGITGHVEEGFIAEQLEQLYPAPDPQNPPTSKEDGHIWWHEYMTDEQKALSSGVHNYYTFFNSEMLEAEIQAAINAASE